MDILTDLPWTLTMGWLVVIAWTVAQAVTWSRLRTGAAATSVPTRERTGERRLPFWPRRDQSMTTIFTTHADTSEATAAPEFLESDVLAGAEVQEGREGVFVDR